ncbi:MAG: hypothetical protein K6A63_04250 [Acholeplasmatales bacterium]|nr:hypothetical protein [Acholeplasmatales bacterium]
MELNEAKEIYFYYLGHPDPRNLGAEYLEYQKIKNISEYEKKWKKDLHSEIKKKYFKKPTPLGYSQALATTTSIEEYVLIVMDLCDKINNDYKNYKHYPFMASVFEPWNMSRYGKFLSEDETLFDIDDLFDFTKLKKAVEKVFDSEEHEDYIRLYFEVCDKHNIEIENYRRKAYEVMLEEFD